MANFDRFDIAEAHAVLEWDYNLGGWLQERPSNKRRMEATSCQLHRLKFRARSDLSLDTLSENSQEIYYTNVLKWGLPIDVEMKAAIREMFVSDWLEENYPHVLEPGNYH